MREGWETQTLEKVCERIFAGGDVPKNNLSKFKTDQYTIPIFANGEKNKGLYGYTDIPKVVDASITVSARGTIGYSEIRNEPFFPIVRLIVLVPNKDIIDLNFLKYVVSSMEFKKSGTSIPQLTVPMIKKYQANIPPLKEQKQIVSTLDKAFKQIDQAKANLEQNLHNAKELFQSKLNEVFSQRGEGWVEKTLNEVSLYFGRGKSKHRPRNDESLFGGEYPFIQTGDVRNSVKYIKAFSQTYNEKGLAQSKLWKKNTVCITIAANIAETAILDIDACFPDSIIGLVVDEKKTTVEFAYYALQFLKSTLQALGKGSAQDNLNMKTFETQYFPFPSIDIQEKIVLLLNELNDRSLKIQTHYQQKLNNLEELKKSILQKAFRGELT